MDTYSSTEYLGLSAFQIYDIVLAVYVTLRLLPDYLTDQLSVQLFHWLTDCLTDWLTDLVNDKRDGQWRSH